MSIASAIQTKQQQVAAAYTAASGKGATMPATENLTNLATCIGSIPSGGGVGIPREIVSGVWQIPSLTTYSLPSGVTEIGQSGFSSAFQGCTSLTNVDFSAVTTVESNGFSSVLRGCTSLTNVDFSSVTTVASSAFLNAFQGCTSLTSVDFSSVTTVESNGFSSVLRDCTSLQSISFPALTTIVSGGFSNAFNGCTSLQSISFPALTIWSFDGPSKNQFAQMMQNTGTSTTHTIHFPSNLEDAVKGLSGYPLFGGTSGYVVLAFDLPATS